MDRRKDEDRRRIGSVKAAVNKNTHRGERILDGNSSLKKPQEDFAKKPSSRARRRDMNRYQESRRAEESQLFSARKTIKDLASMAEQSRMKDNESLTKNGKELAVRSIESYQYAEVITEIELVKQELSKLKLEMASAMGEKARAKKDFEDSNFKICSNATTVEELRQQIEAANEELLLVALARIEALKEVAEIEAQREKEAAELSFIMEEKNKKMKDVIEEIDQSKELERKLAVTLSDNNRLKDGLKEVKELDKMDQTGDGLKQPDRGFRSIEKVEPSVSLESITKELEAVKKELASMREEGLRYICSMDIITNELKHATEETARLTKTEEMADLKLRSMNSKLLRAKSKLNTVTAAEEKAKSILTNLSSTLEHLKTGAEASKKEKVLITEASETIKAEIQKTESEIDLSEERLQAAVQELEAVKSSEASALGKLRSLMETTVQSRASASNQSSTITISKFEYEYLTGRAVGAEEIADKKVAAAYAWIEALKASEREILMKTEIAHKDLREMRVEKHEVYRKERSVSAKKNVDAQNRQSPHHRSMKSKGNLTSSGRAKFLKSELPGIQVDGSNPFIIKKKDNAKFS